jgi:phosphoribosyl 1,2-cyclic phosphodiesterase
LDAILLEANHDVGMLQTGPYPYYLKRRIWGEKGHLSNEACGNLINQIISDKLKHILLGHLSQENNYPALAFQAVRNEINFGKHNFCADDLDLKVARTNTPSSQIIF